MACYLVTGAAGFIGANLVKALNDNGHDEIIAVDNLQEGKKFHNLTDCQLADYFDRDEFLPLLKQGVFDGKISGVLHQGACSDTMETDGRYMMANNYRYSCILLEWAQQQNIPFLYASSAAVYGGSTKFISQAYYEQPLNIYGYSKLLFDRIVRRKIAADTLKIPVVGFRYFNVYGPHESHKGRMASVAFHHFEQYQSRGYVELFKASGGYDDGEQRRDFIYIDDVVRTNIEFLTRAEQGEKFQAIVNLGTGRAQSFNALSIGMINACRKYEGKPPLSLPELQQQKIIRYIDFPPKLIGKYQHFTEANLTCLQAAAGNRLGDDFLDTAAGCEKYCQWLL